MTESGSRAQHGHLDRPALTNREHEVLAMLVNGLSSAEISKHLLGFRARHAERSDLEAARMW